MGITIQKVLITATASLLLLPNHSALANPLKQCSTAPLIVTLKNVGKVTYFAEDCEKSWENQDIRLDFHYTHDIPEWAFKKAATYYLKKNIADFNDQSALNQVTALYKPVKSGDTYSLSYHQDNQKLDLILNQKLLGSIRDAHANYYFKIWFGSTPFNVKLKQQLLN